jgi:hypothetical protein
MWSRVVETYVGCVDYQTQSEREIPIVFLERSTSTN